MSETSFVFIVQNQDKEPMTNVLVMTTNNVNKIKEIKEILVDFPLTVLPYTEVFSEHIEVVEDGTTFKENAIKKVSCYAAHPHRFYLGEDSGMEVMALGGAPGIYSARFAGRETPYSEKCQEIMNRLESQEDRRARFVSVVALQFPDGSIETYDGVVNGHIALESRGDNGFGYDPIFIPDGFDETFGEMNGAQKHRLSHRYQSLQKCRDGRIQTFFTMD